MSVDAEAADRLAIRELVDAYALVTMHFNGQSTVALDGERRLMIAAIRYQDTFAKADGTWRFAERRLYVGWTETRTLEAAGIA
jgi:hypothetical protein